MENETYTDDEMDLCRVMATLIAHDKESSNDVLAKALRDSPKIGIPEERIRHIHGKIMQALNY